MKLLRNFIHSLCGISVTGQGWRKQPCAGYVAIPYIIETVAAAAAVTSTVMSVQASRAQAEAAQQQASYNNQVDQANARQLAMDSAANIHKQRQDDSAFLSAQRAAYAASGVLSGTGSPMAVLSTTAGRQEQDIQQYWNSTQEKESSLYEAGQEGIYEGAQQADIYHLQGTEAIFNGIGQVANIAGRAYTPQAGTGSGPGQTGTNVSAVLAA